MKQKCQLSVIVPVYNKVKYVEKCILSLCNQTMENIKIILVDDGSTDGSIEICRKYAQEDDRIILIRQNHIGPIQARYAGVKNADTEYITFVDSDDWVEADAYERLVPYMNQGYDVIKFLMTLDYGQGKQIDYQNSFMTGGYDLSRIQSDIYPALIWNDKKQTNGVSSSLCDKIVRKSVIQKSFELAMDLHYHFCEDSTISFPMYKWVETLYITDCVLYHHCKYLNEDSTYIADKSFFDNLYLWYKHLIKYVDFIPNATTQIEKIYMDAMQPRKHLYGEAVEKLQFMFPFREVPCGSNIVIWGYGNVGKSYEQQIKQSQYCNIRAVVDKNYEKMNKPGVRSPEVIKNIRPDYIVIAIWDEAIEKRIRESIKKMGFAEEQIIGRVKR